MYKFAIRLVDLNARRAQTYASLQFPKQLTTTIANMESNEPTIIDLKSAFLRSQITALSQPLQPSQNWQDSVSDEENTLRQRAIDEALFKLNTILKQHNKISYPPQAQRHVAEQIDQLYWAAGERDVNVNREEWSEKGADYREFHQSDKAMFWRHHTN